MTKLTCGDAKITTTLCDLVLACREFAGMGDAVGEQAEAVFCAEEPLENQNENAMKMVERWLRGVAVFAEVEDEREVLDELRDAILNSSMNPPRGWYAQLLLDQRDPNSL